MYNKVSNSSHKLIPLKRFNASNCLGRDEQAYGYQVNTLIDGLADFGLSPLSLEYDSRADTVGLY